MTRTGEVLLIAGSPRKSGSSPVRQLALNASHTIAADSGANLAYAHQLPLDYLIGDLDSIDKDALLFYRAARTEIIPADPHKDKTDLQLALELIESRSELRSKPLVVTNVIGGRLDHELAALGIILNIMDNKTLKKIEVAAYIMMGWAIIAGFIPLIRSVPPVSIILLLAGGAAYTLGTVWYRMKNLRFTHVIWHLFVLIGTVCHWFSIWYLR